MGSKTKPLFEGSITNSSVITAGQQWGIQVHNPFTVWKSSNTGHRTRRDTVWSGSEVGCSRESQREETGLQELKAGPVVSREGRAEQEMLMLES